MSVKNDIIVGTRHFDRIFKDRKLYCFEKGTPFGRACNVVLQFVKASKMVSKKDVLKYVYSNQHSKIELINRILKALKSDKAIRYANGWKYCLR